jgi:hypothetical protein
MLRPEHPPFLIAFDEEDHARLRRLDNRAQRYAIPSYLWEIAVNEVSEVKFMRKMREENIPLITTVANVTPDKELALLTAEC